MKATKMKTAIITGYALNDDGKLELMENVRRKRDGQDSSSSVTTRFIGETYPNTRAGCKKAQAECLRRNLSVVFK